MAGSPRLTSQSPVLVIADLNSPVQEWIASLASMGRAGADVLVLAHDQSVRATELLAPLGVRCEEWTLSRAITEVVTGGYAAGVVLSSPATVSDDAFDACLAILTADPRVATVSFFSNSADHLSFPYPRRPTATLPSGWDETLLTQRLRELNPDVASVPVPLPAGPLVAVSPAAVRALAAWEDTALGASLSVVDFALRAARRGFRNVLDPRTVVNRQSVPGAAAPEPLTDPQARAWIEERHPLGLALYDHERLQSDTPLEHASNVARCSTIGMKILVECDVLGPIATGTQVALLATVSALARHPLVRELLVGVPNGLVPPYAWETLNRPGIQVVNSSHYMFDGISDIDVLYRPYQPQRDLPYARWRQVARRLVASVLDLIAYDNGAYHQTQEDWMAYRGSLKSAVSCLDSVIAISDDVADSIRRAGLPISSDRVAVVRLGTDHLDPQADEACPRVLAASAHPDRPYLLVIGAAYAHKNRDLAIAAWHLLRERGHDVDLILAGVMTAAGSSRNDEALRTARGPLPLVIPDISDAERTWLYRRASVVLYPTSAEGFGLVPFEAATYGRPTAFVGFGPLGEMLGDVPGTADDWSPEAFADAVERLLVDRSASEVQVAAIKKRMGALTWRSTAERLVHAFLATLQRPRLGDLELVSELEDARRRVAESVPLARPAMPLAAAVQSSISRIHRSVVRLAGRALTRGDASGKSA